jgi:hypothetical protein
MAFNGSEGEAISLNEAATMTSAYRSANPNATRGHFAGSSILNNILTQSGCVGIRTYYGIDSSGQKQLVMVGVDASGNDMTSGIIADRLIACPQLCSTSNPLNS